MGGMGAMGRRYKAFEVTRQAICGALKQLLAQSRWSGYRAEIMDSCGSRRQHFYYYFTDIYDLLRWAFENEALELARCQVDRQGWQEGFLRLFRYIAENRDICLCALDSLGREYLKGIFGADIKSIVRSAVRQMALEKRLSRGCGAGGADNPLSHHCRRRCAGGLAAGRADADAGGTDPTGR